MSKKRSVKFWIIFWTASVAFLSLWYAFWEFRNHGVKSVIPVLDMVSFFQGDGEEYKNAALVADYVMKKDDSEKVFLVLFQNNLELRPGGGFIGAFGIIKIKNGEVVSIETHDLSNFDNRIPDGTEPPYPMKETLKIKSWKMRDSNYSPDFETNAKKAEEFYYMGQGQEKFDGIIGVTTNVFSSILKAVGPVQLPDYPGIYDSENAVITLEYQVEKAFEEQGIDRENRKSILTELAEEIENKISTSDVAKKIDVGKELINALNQKEIVLYFKDPEMKNTIEKAGWDGKMDGGWSKDYLMLVDANLGAFKSDYYMKRSVNHIVDLSGDVPKATLEITYNHTAKQKDWMTRDYATYLRVYVPKGSWLTEEENFGNTQYGEENGRQYFGSLVRIPIGTEKTVKITYTLPKDFSNGMYDLLLQKQTGVLDVPYKISIIGKDGRKTETDLKLNSDVILSELEK